MKMDTSSEGGFTGQGPLLTVQRNLFSPTVRPETELFALFTEAITPVPLTTLHVPCAGVGGALAASVVVLVGVQKDLSRPALAPLTVGSKVSTTTWSFVVPFAHGPLFTVHWKVLVPMLRAVTVVVGEVGEVMVPLPFTKVHCPVAGKMGTLPVSVAVPGLQTC